jgi:RNA polymerase sigma-70 factor (ECF subfamily)
MDGDQTSQLEPLLDRANRGDDSARQALVGRAYQRLSYLAKRMLHHDFPRLKRAHGTGSLVHKAAIGILEALQVIRPPTVRDFFRLAAQHMRWVLLDWARNLPPEPLPLDLGVNDPPAPADCQPGKDFTDPEWREAWAELHQQAEKLPPQERDVFDLVGYGGLTQAEAARSLNLSPRTVRYRWNKACLLLADRVKGFQKRLRDRR